MCPLLILTLDFLVTVNPYVCLSYLLSQFPYPTRFQVMISFVLNDLPYPPYTSSRPTSCPKCTLSSCTLHPFTLSLH